MPPTCPLSALYLFIHLSNSCFGFLFVPSSSMLLLFCFLINWDHNTTSVTRFGEISPLWQYFKSLGQFCTGLFRVKQNFEPTLANLLCSLANFGCSKRPNIEQLIKPSGHTEHDTIKTSQTFNFE